MKTRRQFLKGVAATGTLSGLVQLDTDVVQAAAQSTQAAATASALPPSAYVEAMEERDIPDGYSEAEAHEYFVNKPAADYMTDVIKKLGIDYIASNPGSSHRGLQESIIAYGGNKSPEWLTCLHEESSVAMGHGYAKLAYKPMAMACHSTVGLQHAAMAVYNAFCDRVPIVLFGGNHFDANDRRPGAEWSHAAQDPAKLLRDFTKWDDSPVSVTHFMESMMRAYKVATTPPMGPVAIMVDGHLSEIDVDGQVLPAIPDFTPTTPPQGENGALREAARLLVEAERPVIMVDMMARTPAGIDGLLELAEALQVPVVDRGGRMNFPNDHYLNQSGNTGQLVREADVILGMEMKDFWGSVNSLRDRVHRSSTTRTSADVKLIHLGVNDMFMKANYQYFQRFQPVDLSIGGDAEASLPTLTEEVKQAMSSQRKARNADRQNTLRENYQTMMERSRQQATYGWNSSPISCARLSMELWHQIKGEDYSMVGKNLSGWPRRLWKMNKHYHYAGGSGGGGLGYQLPAAVGSALANREHGRLSVSIQTDGDINYAPGALWTAAHHNIPLLWVMHNNRSYHQEVMHLQRMGTRRQRGIDGAAKIGTTFEDPFITYTDIAKGYGVWAEGPIENPHDLGPAIRRAIDVVKQGQPALVDVICEPR
jgi:acetolactate synthase-1/2/3 large subunit